MLTRPSSSKALKASKLKKFKKIFCLKLKEGNSQIKIWQTKIRV
jgi:hypothetical protein